MISGKKVTEKEWIKLVAKELALRANRMPSQKDTQIAEFMAKNGGYTEYLKQYEKPKKVVKE